MYYIYLKLPLMFKCEQSMQINVDKFKTTTYVVNASWFKYYFAVSSFIRAVLPFPRAKLLILNIDNIDCIILQHVIYLFV